MKISVKNLKNKEIYKIQFKTKYKHTDKSDYCMFLLYLEAIKRIYNSYLIGETEYWDYINGEKRLVYAEYFYSDHCCGAHSQSAINKVAEMFTALTGEFEMEYFKETAFVYLPNFYSKENEEKLANWLRDNGYKGGKNENNF